MSKCSTCRNLYRDGQIATEELRILIYDRCIETCAGEFGCDVGGRRSGVGRCSPSIASVDGASIRNACHGWRIALLGYEDSFAVGNVDDAAVSVQFHVYLRRRVAVGMVEPECLEAFGWNFANFCRKYAFFQVAEFVTVVPRWIHEHIHVGSHDFVDDDRCRGGVVLSDSHVACGRRTGVVGGDGDDGGCTFGVCGDDAMLIHTDDCRVG